MTIFKGWQVFQIYNLYRILLIICLVSYRYLDISSNSYNELLNQDAYLVLMMYAILVLYFVWRAYLQHTQFETLLIASAFADLLFLNTFILYVGTLEHGVGVLLNIAIAALAIMVAGLTSLFYAVFESIMMISYTYYQESSWSAVNMFYSGIHGVGFFTTAITSLALAHWIKNINKVADLRRLEIQSLQELNRHVIEKINAAIILVNQHLQLMFMNETAKKWLLMRGKSQSDPFVEISGVLFQVVKDYFETSIKTEEKHSLIDCQKLLTIMPYGEGENSAAVLLIEDAKALMAQAQQLKLASLGRFTASIAHELRNPLSAISHASQILASSNKLTEQECRFNEIINKNCNRMNDLIKNVLQLSRQEPSKPAVIELNDF